MLKFLFLILIIIAVLVYLALRNTPRRPPRDWRRGGDDGGPILPAGQIGLDAGEGRKHDDSSRSPAKERAEATADSDGGDGSGD